MNGRPWVVRGQKVMVAAVAMALLASTASAQSYRVIDVPPLAGGYLEEFRVNDHLLGVGVMSAAGERRAFLFDGAWSRWLAIDQPLDLAVNNAALVGGIRSRPRRAGVGPWERVAFFFNALDGSGYLEVVLPDDASPTIRRLTDSGILLLTTTPSVPPRSYAVYRGRLYDLSAFGNVVDIDEDGTIGGSDADGAFVTSLAGLTRRPFDRPAALTHLRKGHVLARSGASLLYARPDGVTSQIPLIPPELSPFALDRSWVNDMNGSGEMVGGRVSGVRTLLFQPVLILDGTVHSLTDYEIEGLAPRYYTEALRVTDGGLVVVEGYLFHGESGPYMDPAHRVVSILIPTGAPGRPQGLSFTVTGTLVSLSWQPSAGALEYLLEAGSTWGASDILATSVGSSHSVAGVVPPGRYFVRVRARNANGVSPASDEVTIVVP